MPDTRILQAGSVSPLAMGLNAARRGWSEALVRIERWAGVLAAHWGGGEVVPEYVELTRGLRTVSEMRQALVRVAFRLSEAKRVELDVYDGPEGVARRVATWPPPGSAEWQGDLEDSAYDATEVGSPLCLSLRFGGRSHGTLRLIPGRRRRWPSRLIRRLTAVCALAGAVERISGPAGDDDAARDPVTGAFNAAFLSAFLTQAVAQARRRGEPLSVLCAGADWLEGVREEHGTEIADSAVRRMARAMAATLRASDVVARLDDGRLIALLPAAALADAMRVAESVRRAIIEAGLTAATPAPLTSSIGVAAYPDHAADAGHLLAAAREALARARTQGAGFIATAPRPAQPLVASIVRPAG
jgi:diguanylate cyclase (GGDEF)-like protein